MRRTPASPDAFGPSLHDGGVTFRAWAPAAERMAVVLQPGTPDERSVDLNANGEGFFSVEVSGIGAGCRYLLRRDDEAPQPDPASAFQPDGVWGASEVIDPAFDWSDADWRGVPAEKTVLYELHVGAFSSSGTYDGVRERLDHLVELGITTLKLMPLATCPGRRNWGYDGVFHLAPFAGYGRPRELRRLVDACHARGLAVLVDVVTNHFGPEGNPMWTLARDFFTAGDTTPWGPGPRFDSEVVLAWFAQMARVFRRDYHVDGLRIDAFDTIPRAHRGAHLQTMIDALQAHLPEDAHATMMLESTDDERAHLRVGEPGVSVTQLSFDFQRAAHRWLTGERHGVYRRYDDPVHQLVRCFSEARPVRWPSVIHTLQNHDNPGNRYRGERLETLIDARRWRAAQAWLLLQPAVPYLFMGSEWGSRRPWLFFTDFSEDLGRRIEASRRASFEEVDPDSLTKPPPGPQDPRALVTSTLDWGERARPEPARRLRFTRELIALRGRVRARMTGSTAGVQARSEAGVLSLHIAARSDALPFLLKIHLGEAPTCLPAGAELVFASDPLPDPGVLPPDTTVLCRLHG